MAENIVELLTDVADAIREKKGTTEKINAQNFSDEIRNLPSSSGGWTGHADVEGLKAIGWDDDDIAYYQEHGVNWNEEDDEYHLVSEDNKALYGVLTADNISAYKDRIVYLPKIDTSKKTSFAYLFNGCSCLVALPYLDTSSVTSFEFAFSSCYALVSIPLFDTTKATNASYMFNNCYTLARTPQFNFTNVRNATGQFAYCYALIDYSIINAHNIAEAGGMYANCRSLVSIEIDTQKIKVIATITNNCYSLQYANFKNVSTSVSFNTSPLLSKKSVLYMIQNEAATSAIVITLHADAYARAMADSEIQAALEAHPNVSLASA